MRIVRGLWKILVGVKDALVLCAMLLFFGLLYAALSSRPNTAIASGGALVLALDGSIVEQTADARPLALLAGRAPVNGQFRLRDLVRVIRAAATDSRVKAVVLDLDGFDGGGQTAMSDIGAALDTVRRAGKPVLAYAAGYDDDAYQVAAHASEIWLDPLGAVTASGPGGSQLYYKALLDRIGADVHVYRVGEYKSAVEPYTRMNASPAARQADEALLEALWGDWQAEVARARPKAQFARYIADPVAAAKAAGGDPAAAALRLGLVDHIGEEHDFGRRVAAIVGAGDAAKDQDFRTIALDDWTAANPVPSGGAAIGVVTVAGDIVDRSNQPGAAGGEDIARRLRKALANDDLKALVVRVDSPGGSVTGSERIRSAIVAAKAKHIHVIVSMGSVAASGGYWVATTGDRILAEPATITGSIGVFAMIPTFENTLAKVGIGTDPIRATPYSGQPDVFTGTTPAVDALIQAGVESFYGRFTHLVAASRRMTPQHVDTIAQGRVWAGGVAHQLGLVDGFGSLDDAVALAARMAKLDPAKVHPVYIERGPSFFSQLFSGWSHGSDSRAIDGWSHAAARPDMILARALAESRMVLDGPTIQARCLPCAADSPAAGACHRCGAAAAGLRRTVSRCTIRDAAANDAGAIAAIYRPYVLDTPITFELDPPDDAEFARRIAAVTAHYPYLVAEQDGAILGYAYARRYRDRAAYDWVCECGIYVDRARARRGVGRELYEALFDRLTDRGFITVVASITVPNRASTAFHAALGFEDRGIQRGIGFKAGKWHDVAFWQLDLAPRPARPERPR